MVNQTKEGRAREREQVRRSRRAIETSALDQDARDLANDAISRSDAHEILCTERWKTQGEAMTRIEVTMTSVNTAINDKIGKLPAGIIAGLTGLVGYLAARAFPAH